jgi:hypothetical protein
MQEARLPIPNEPPQMDSRMELIKRVLNYTFPTFRYDPNERVSVPKLLLAVILAGAVIYQVVYVFYVNVIFNTDGHLSSSIVFFCWITQTAFTMVMLIKGAGEILKS